MLDVAFGLSVVSVIREELLPSTVKLPPATIVWVIKCWNWMVLPAAPAAVTLKLYQLLFPVIESCAAFCKVKETVPFPGVKVPALFHCAPFIVMVKDPAPPFKVPVPLTLSVLLIPMPACRVTFAEAAIVRL